MKRIRALLCALALLCAVTAASAAQAQEADQAILSAKSLLTEVYGYLQEETDDFDYQVTETNTSWQISFAPKAHPDWVYTGEFRKSDGQFMQSSSPFKTGYVGYPGENGVRDALRSAAQNGWFTQWDAAAKAAFRAELDRQGVTPSDSLLAGLSTDGYTAAQAVEDYFLSCYGPTDAWPDALTAWRDEVLASCGAAADAPSGADAAQTDTDAQVDAPATDAAADAPAAQVGLLEGLRTRTVTNAKSNRTFTITEFRGETPAMLSQALAHPRLEGWTCLCGALRQGNDIGDHLSYDCGLAAFEKDGVRLLTTMYRLTDSDEWLVAPVSEKALLADRDFDIVYNGDENTFDIEYPVSDTVCEYYRCNILFYTVGNAQQPLCKLMEYRRLDTLDGSGVVIDSQPDRSEACWYNVTTTAADGSSATEADPALLSGFLDHIDVSQFPTSAEACREAAQAAPAVPEGYGVTGGVHLRAKTSSHSTDLGTLEHGALVEVLGTLPGDPWPWYQVRTGLLEGYVSSVYMKYDELEPVLNSLTQQQPLCVAKTTRACALKKGTGLFDGKVEQLEAGTMMHVVAVRGKWLYVSIPQGDIDWMMDINGTYGFVKAGNVTQAVTPIQLEWMD